MQPNDQGFQGNDKMLYGSPCLMHEAAQEHAQERDVVWHDMFFWGHNFLLREWKTSRHSSC